MWAPFWGPSAASLQPRPARSYTQTLVSRATARAIQPRSEGAARDLVPGRPWGCPSRCSAGAAGAHQRQSAGRALNRPSRRAPRARSRSRRLPRQSPTASTGYSSHRALRLRSCRRTRRIIQTTSPNRTGGHTSSHRCSDDQPDPTLGHRLDASGFLEVAVVDCRIHDGLISMRD
jgi:hypothetical protein